MHYSVGVVRVIAVQASLVAFGPAVSGEVDTGLTERVYYDAPDEQGRLSGGFTYLPLPDLAALAAGPAADWTTIVDNGPSANRIDFVFVGDGYVETELGLYAVHVNAGLNVIVTQEPLQTYSSYFNFHRVDVISNESGVDNDPVQGIFRDTALDMLFWCAGIERLLCVSVPKAYQYAGNAPDVDHVLAVANSVKYGGAGYSGSDVATYSGGNSLSPEVAVHEMGHSLGNLADEYDYADGATYYGGELSQRNVSILEASAMAAANTKWADWLGDPGIGFGGLVSTFEGAAYYEFGIYRPTFNSKMRTLNNPFNLPSAEGLIIEIYKLVDPIDDATPTGQILDGSETLFVVPLEPVGHSLDVQWTLDSEPVPGATGTTLDLSALNLAGGMHLVSVTVTDPTELVRDEPARDLYLSQTISWEIVVQDSDSDGIPDDEDACPESVLTATIIIDGCDSGVGNLLFEDGCTMADLIAECAEGAVNHGQFVSCVALLTIEWRNAGLINGQEMGSIESCAAIPGDLDGDGAVGVADLMILLGAWGPCPAHPDTCPGDVDLDDIVGISDLLILLANWG